MQAWLGPGLRWLWLSQMLGWAKAPTHGLDQALLHSARADYDVITIRSEVNGLVEPLTDPHVRLLIYDDVLLTETKY